MATSAPAWGTQQTGELAIEIDLAKAALDECQEKMALLSDVHSALSRLKDNVDIDGSAYPDARRIALLASLKAKSAAARAADGGG